MKLHLNAYLFKTSYKKLIELERIKFPLKNILIHIKIISNFLIFLKNLLINKNKKSNNIIKN